MRALIVSFEPAEPNRDEFPHLELPCRILVDDGQKLCLFRRQRQHKASPWLELIQQSRRRPLSRHANQDLVEWGVLGPAPRPVSDANSDIREAKALQQSLGMVCEFLDDFDAPNLSGEFREDCGLIAQAGADLE